MLKHQWSFLPYHDRDHPIALLERALTLQHAMPSG